MFDAFRRIVQVLRVGSRAAERDVGLSAAQLFVLERLADSDRPLSVNELAERTLTHQSSVSVVVQKLEARGLVSRSPAEDDARRSQLTITPAAAKLMRGAPPVAQRRILDALAAMPAARRAALADLLGELSRRVVDGDPNASTAAAPAMFFEDPHLRSSRKKGARRARPRR